MTGVHDFGAAIPAPPPEAEGSISPRVICKCCGVLLRFVRESSRRVRVEYAPPIVSLHEKCSPEPRWQRGRIPCRL